MLGFRFGLGQRFGLFPEWASMVFEKCILGLIVPVVYDQRHSTIVHSKNTSAICQLSISTQLSEHSQLVS